MTVSNETYRNEYSGNDVTTEFTIGFYFLVNAHIKAILKVTSTGVETELTLTTHYTLAGAGNEAGGTLTMVTEPATGETLTILRNVDLKQETDYVEGGSFPSDDHEDAIDKLTMLVQQLQEKLDRFLSFTEASTYSGITLPDPSALKFLRWNAGLTAIENFDISDVSALAVSDFTETLLDDETAIAWLTTLGIDVDVLTLSLPVNTTISAFAKTLLDDAGAIAAIATLLVTTKGGDLTSANPLVIDTDGHVFDVAGTENFATMTVAANRLFVLMFDGILTMTHHATNLNLPGGANITTAAGDRGIFFSTGANTVYCLDFTRASEVYAALGANSDITSLASLTTPLTKAQGGSGTTGDSIIKGWIHFNGTGTVAINDSFNVDSITDVEVGGYDVTWDTDFANANYPFVGMSNGYHVNIVIGGGLAAGAVRIENRDTAHSKADRSVICCIAMGDQ